MYKATDVHGSVPNTHFWAHSRKIKFLINLYVSKLNHRKLVFLMLFLLLFSIIYFAEKPWLSNNEITDNNSTTNAPNTIPRLIQCYRSPQEDKDVLVLPDYEVKPNSIFFVETSCKHVNGRINLTERMACAYESAARAHLDSEVLVLFPSPISLKNPSLLVTQLLKYPNLKLVHVDLEKFTTGTPLENFDIPKKLLGGCCPIVHSSDILRLLTLWKYGGTYMDSDFLVLRSVNKMDNYAGIQYEDSINNAILNINISSEGGKEIVDGFLLELRDNFRNNDWGYNGPRLVKTVLKRICNETNGFKMTPEICKGFTVFPGPPTSPFYPVTPGRWHCLFEDTITEKTIDNVGQKLAIHMYNSQNRGHPVKKGSKMLYSVLASWFCPEVYSVMGDTF